MTTDVDIGPARVNGILAGLRTREWPENETVFTSREKFAEFIENLAADRDRWKAATESMRERAALICDDDGQELAYSGQADNWAAREHALTLAAGAIRALPLEPET